MKKELDTTYDLKLRVHTPEGQARKNLPIIKTSIMRFARGTAELEGKKDNKILFNIHCKNDKVRTKIIRRAAKFEAQLKMVWGQFAKKAVGRKHKEEMQKMLNKTKVEVVE